MIAERLYRMRKGTSLATSEEQLETERSYHEFVIWYIHRYENRGNGSGKRNRTPDGFPPVEYYLESMSKWLSDSVESQA